MTIIGTLRPERLTCTDEHLPGCWNPWQHQTWCLCGAHRWPGQVGTWHSAACYDHAGQGASVIGYDTYFLHADGCTVHLPKQWGHVCEVGAC